MKKTYSPMKIVGTFWLIMGGFVLLASIFPPTVMGKVVNLIAGGLLVLMGGLFLFLNRRFKR
jgi:xanthine/uracil permease